MSWIGRSIRRFEDRALLLGRGRFTAADLADVKPIRPLLHRPDYVPIAQPVLARERVNYVGEAFAVVVAEDAASAEDIAESI